MFCFFFHKETACNRNKTKQTVIQTDITYLSSWGNTGSNISMFVRRITLLPTSLLCCADKLLNCACPQGTSISFARGADQRISHIGSSFMEVTVTVAYVDTPEACTDVVVTVVVSALCVAAVSSS